MARTAAAPRLRRRERKNITSGTAHVNATFNNTMITITDAQGNAIAWSSSGSQGFKGSRKSTPYAAQMAAEDAGRKAMEHGMRTLEIEVKGPGSGRSQPCGPCKALVSLSLLFATSRRSRITAVARQTAPGLTACARPSWLARRQQDSAAGSRGMPINALDD